MSGIFRRLPMMPDGSPVVAGSTFWVGVCGCCRSYLFWLMTDDWLGDRAPAELFIDNGWRIEDGLIACPGCARREGLTA